VARLGERVTRAAALVSFAPPDAPGFNWYDGMTDQNVRDFSTCDTDYPTFVERVRARANRLRHDPETIFDVLRTQTSKADNRVIYDFAIRRLLADAHREALRDGPYGWIDDTRALRRPWGFDLSSITVPVRLWHGADDAIAPVSHTRWLAGRIPGAQLQVQTGVAHFGAVEILPEILSWLAVREPLANTRAR
jgi:pimeloyl-ACP methyl ester carboxylesterase